MAMMLLQTADQTFTVLFLVLWSSSSAQVQSSALLFSMSGRKMLQFPSGSLLLLLICLICGQTRGEVGDFGNCLPFFYKGTPPQGITGAQYKPICQIYNNIAHFATLFNQNNRTPLYSAYILSEADGGRPDTKWMNEPQLALSNEDKNMKHYETPDGSIMDSQAIDVDYKESGYTRGHLAPSSHQKTEEGRKATFTLTNIVPQTEGSNSAAWNKFEGELLERSKGCTGTMYVITGVLPYESEGHKMKNRVVIPEYIWSAYCCTSSQSDKFPTYAAVGRNDENSDNTIVKKEKGFDVKQMPLQDLENILKTRLKMENISLFKKQCK